MQEYQFPSGGPVQVPIDDHWLWLVHVGLSSILILSVAAILWRRKQPPSGWDIAGWMIALFTELFLVFPMIGDRVSSDIVAPYFFIMLLVAVVGITIGTWRWMKTPIYRLGFVLLVFGIAVFMFLLPAIQSREASYRAQCWNNLKQISLAMSNYHDVHHQLPFAGGVTPKGGPVCSWRVAIAAYVEPVPWDRMYHFDEPWDSSFNKRAQDRSPYSYHCPSHSSERRFTDYAMLRGPGTVGADGLTAAFHKQNLDGESNTILAVEACGTEIIWTEPKDVELNDESLGINLPGRIPGRSRGIISSYHTGGGYVAMSDGSIRYMSEKTDKKVLKALATIRSE